MSGTRTQQLETEIETLDEIVSELGEALAWAMRQAPRPTRRITGQNEQYFDSYQKALIALNKWGPNT